MKVRLKNGGWAIKYTGYNKDEVEKVFDEAFPDFKKAIKWEYWHPGFWLVCTVPGKFTSCHMHRGEELDPEWLMEDDGLTNFTRNIMKDWFIYR